jgi:hypothetical protein
MPGDIISECPGDFIGIRKFERPSIVYGSRVLRIGPHAAPLC